MMAVGKVEDRSTKGDHNAPPCLLPVVAGRIWNLAGVVGKPAGNAAIFGPKGEKSSGSPGWRNPPCRLEGASRNPARQMGRAAYLRDERARPVLRPGLHRGAGPAVSDRLVSARGAGADSGSARTQGLGGS